MYDSNRGNPPPRYCMRCGAPLSGRYCSQCGQDCQPPLPLGSPSFPNYGLPMHSDPSTPPIMPPPAQQWRSTPRRPSPSNNWIIGIIVSVALLLFVIGGAFLVLLASRAGTYYDNWNHSPDYYYDYDPYGEYEPYDDYDPYDDGASWMPITIGQTGETHIR